MRTEKRLIAVAAAMAAFLVLSPSSRAAYDDVGVGARVTGLGRAYTAVSDDVYSIYYNPAGLATLDRKEFSTTYSRLLTGLSDGSNLQNSFLGYAHPFDEGRKGTLGVAWNYFTLDSLYRESSFFTSYGRRMTREDRPAPVYFGASFKMLNRSVGGTSAATNAINNTGVATNTADPVLAKNSKMNYDTDLGVMWRLRPRWTLGMTIQHTLEPNIAFASADSDKLGRNIKFGGAYKTPFSTLTGDIDLMSAPDHSLDKIAIVGVEKWLPTLLHGSFGVRGALSLGTRDHREIAMGLSYKIHRMQVDYGFALPVGGLTSTNGSHRVGLTWRFGAPRQADVLLGEMLLENLSSSAQVGSPEFNRQAADLVAYKRKAIDALMRDADAEAQLGRFMNAHERSRQAASLAPRDTVLAELDERYRTSAAYFPDLSGQLHTPMGAATHDGIMKFIAGKERDCLVALANGRALATPPTPAHDGLIRIIEAKVGAPAPSVSTEAVAAVEVSTAVAAAPAVSTVTEPTSAEESLKRILDSTSALLEVSFFQQEWDKVIQLAQQILALDPGNVTAYRRLAGAYHALKRPAEALKALKAAYALESDPEERSKLRSYVMAMQAIVERQSRPAEPKRQVRAGTASPEQIERLYDAGVELYAQGRLPEALEAFRRVLELDSNYTPAQRAYQRVQAEMGSRGQ